MRSKYASGVVVLAHCLSTNGEYPLGLISKRQLLPLVDEYQALMRHMDLNEYRLPSEMKALRPSFEKIGMLMEKHGILHSITDDQENNEHA